MIRGLHGLYSSDADASRAFIRDKPGFRSPTQATAG